MDQIRAVLQELAVINESYELSAVSINALLEEMSSSKVCTPVIGKFSAGKSALLNALLGYSSSLLKENITLETAVPTEITYHEKDSAIIVHSDEEVTVTDIASFRAGEFIHADRVQSIRLKLRNEHILAACSWRFTQHRINLMRETHAIHGQHCSQTQSYQGFPTTMHP